MQAVYTKSIHVQQYASGNIWGVVMCNDVETQQNVKVKGTFDRYPVCGDMLNIGKYDVVNDPKYGQHFSSVLIQVSHPTDPHVLPKYLKATGIINIHGFGDKKLSVLLKDPTNVWSLLATPPEEWDESYHDIPVSIREQLCQNFNAFKTKTRSASTLRNDIALLMLRLNVNMTNRSISRITDYMKEKGAVSQCIETYLQEHILDLIGVISTSHIKQIATGFKMDDITFHYIDVLDRLNASEDSGHTWTPRKQLQCTDEILEDLEAADHVFTHGKCVFRRQTYEDEGLIASYLSDLCAEDSSLLDEINAHTHLAGFMTNDDLRYTSEQKQVVWNAFHHRVSLLTGGPGTGKTSAITGVLSMLDDYNLLDNSVLLLAPTGKAVSRILSMLNKDGFDQNGITTCTVHRFICASAKRAETLRLVIIDEMSMVDVNTLANCFRVLESYPEVHIVLVGDPDQLPSIRCGNILADIIASNVFPRVHLTKILRQDKGDLMNAIQSIREGVTPCLSKKSQEYVYGGEDVVTALKKIVPAFKDKPQQLLIITPTNAAIAKYQNEVRKILNPEAESCSSFVAGDRVIQCKNVYEDEAAPRFNGMIGTIQHIVMDKRRKVKVEFGEKRFEEEEFSKVFVEFDNDDKTQTVLSIEEAKTELDFAYILTVHKAQGSQANTVVIILEDYGYQPEFITRNLLYTAVSRAEEKCIIVGSLDTYAHAVQNELPKRRSCLRQWLIDMKN